MSLELAVWHDPSLLSPWPRIHIVEATPQIWIDRKLLDEIASPHAHPDVMWSPDLRVFTIDGRNRRVVYRLDFERNHPTDQSLIYAEWPD